MKVAKILLWMVLLGLIATQLMALIQKVGNSDIFSYGFIVGKLLLIGLLIIIGKIATNAIDRKTN
ncbi:MAG: hypothetical protein AAF985_06480 [Bacteroidota bacterium]